MGVWRKYCVTTIDKSINLTCGRYRRFHIKETLFDVCLEGRMMLAKKKNFYT